MRGFGMTRTIAIGAACFIAGYAFGLYSMHKYQEAEEKIKLENAIDEKQVKDQNATDEGVKFEERRNDRQNTKVIYVEKPVYRDCRPDPVWLQQFDQAIETDNAGELSR